MTERIDTDRPITNHAEATALLLEHYANVLRAGGAPEDHGWMVEMIGRMMARRP